MTEARSNSRCAIYTRKSSEEGLDQTFNSLHAQREACEAYVLSQKHEGWKVLPIQYNDGGFSGGNMERPGLKKLLEDISAGKIDTVVVYKVDRLTRSLSDFAKIVDSFDSKGVSFVSVTQQFNTTSSMGRLTLNVLLSFAQFEREVTGERIRDKIAASKKKGMYMGGSVPLGYDVSDHKLVINKLEAETVRMIFARYLALQNVFDLQEELQASGIRSKRRVSATGRQIGGVVLCRGTLYHLLSNPIYAGKIRHKTALYEGQHEAIIDAATWEQTSEMLKKNGVLRKNRKNLPSGRMLHGKLETEAGLMYTPTHAAKGGRRYFYYTIRRRLPDARRDRIERLPALEIEQRVLSSINCFLADSVRVADCFRDLDLKDTKLLVATARHRATVLIQGSTSDKSSLIGKLVSKVIVLPQELRIELDKAALQREFLNREASAETARSVVLAEPYQLARRGNEVRLILANHNQQQEEPVPTLVRAVAQAKSWYEWIIRGEVITKREIAKRTGLNENYVARILQLTVLSPPLTEAILKGNHPPALTVLQLTTQVEMDWGLQRLAG